MKGTIERRSTDGVVHLRGDPSAPVAHGYAIMYGRYSSNLGGYVEVCKPGMVDKSLGDRIDVLARFQHDSDMLLGRVSAGTLRLTSDTTGLAYEADLPDTTYARDLAALMTRGDVRHSSFAFRVAPGGDSWGFTEQGFPLRSLEAVQLVDVAPVVAPAYLDTTSGLRSLAEQRGLDLDTVRRAAAADDLGPLMRSGAPTVIDLGARPTLARDGACACCDVCAAGTPDCPGCPCTTCDSGMMASGNKTTPKKTGRSTDDAAQGATHAIAMHRRRLALSSRSTPPGAERNSPSPSTTPRETMRAPHERDDRPAAPAAHEHLGGPQGHPRQG